MQAKVTLINIVVLGMVLFSLPQGMTKQLVYTQTLLDLILIQFRATNCTHIPCVHWQIPFGSLL